MIDALSVSRLLAVAVLYVVRCEPVDVLLVRCEGIADAGDDEGN